MDMQTQTTQLDLNWFRDHLLDDILPKWLPSITEQGLFLSHFDRTWKPLGRNYGTLVSQCRLLYNFSQGYALTGDKTYYQAVEGGAQFLLDHFRDQEHGGWYWSCGLDGEVLDPRKDSYGHAFVIFGLAHAAQCTGNAQLKDALLHTWEIFDRRFRDEHGGFTWRMNREFVITEQIKSQNPVMHLFEALLAASDVKGAEHLLEAARGVGDFVLSRLVRSADRRLPEVYSLDWQELPERAGESGERSYVVDSGRLDIGHAFEWAFLMSWAVDQGLPATYRSYGNSFLLYGLALGFDWEAGGIYSPASPTGQIVGQYKGWWEQCEAIRALARYAIRDGRSDLLEPLEKTIQFVKASLIDPEYGGWFAGVEGGKSLVQSEKGNEWKLDYHVVGMCMEAIRLAEQAKSA
jgi:mannose/cellobiose epimerase-like protein (N-acyl-D-glucosamine 2-epimerase family)